MSQNSYDYNMGVAQAGLKADVGFDNVLTYRAYEDIGFGLGLVQGSSDRDGRLPMLNTAVLTFSADLVASNEVNMDVNGVSIDPITFNTDHATTLADLAAEISTLEGVNASVTGAREVTVIIDDAVALVENAAVTGGATQATISVAYKTSDSFIGISLRTHNVEQDYTTGVAQYLEGSAVNVLSKGRVYVEVEQDVAVGDAVYLRHTTVDDLKRGSFRKDNGSGNAFAIEGARFTKSAKAGTLAIAEINLPR